MYELRDLIVLTRNRLAAVEREFEENFRSRGEIGAADPVGGRVRSRPGGLWSYPGSGLAEGGRELTTNPTQYIQLQTTGRFSGPRCRGSKPQQEGGHAARLVHQLVQV